MAHTYTTARGKTKKAKEGIRKDAKNNAANKLMTKIAKNSPKAQEDVPIAKEFLNRLKSSGGEAKQKAILGASLLSDPSESLDPTEVAVTNAIYKIRLQLPSYQRCFYIKCAGSSQMTFKHCGNCRIARYCSGDCQKNDWRAGHKSNCGKSDAIVPGDSVAIRPIESYTSFLPESAYPKSLCVAPCNEIHGIILSKSEKESIATVEIFDAELIPTTLRLEVALQDVVVSGWHLKKEKTLINEKLKKKVERQKHETSQAKMLAKEPAENEKCKQYQTQNPTKQELHTVDWSLIEEQSLCNDLELHK